MNNTLDEELLNVFTWPNPKDPEFNERRLLLRRQLESWIEQSWGANSSEYEVRSTLTHPHQFNHFRVNSIRVQFGRTKSESKELISLLGQEFKDALSSPGRNLHIESRLDEQGLSCAVRIPAEAWWDFRPLMDEGDIGGQTLFEVVKQLPDGFQIETKSWPSDEQLSELEHSQWIRLLKSLKPGEFDVVFRKRLALALDPVKQLCEQWKSLQNTYLGLQWKL